MKQDCPIGNDTEGWKHLVEQNHLETVQQDLDAVSKKEYVIHYLKDFPHEVGFEESASVLFLPRDGDLRSSAE